MDKQDIDCAEPACYEPNNDPYPLCKGANTPQGWTENDCYHCCLYEDYEKYNEESI